MKTNLNKYIEYTKAGTQNDYSEIINWVNTTLNAYLNKNSQNVENVSEIEHIIDYMKSSAAPKRLSKMSYSDAKRKSEEWMQTQIKKGDHIPETDADVKTILRSKTSGMRLVKLIGENAFKREGYLMRHCVGSYANRTDCEVYSLRDHKNEPHVTFEVRRQDGLVNQIKGKGNGEIHPDYIKYVLKTLKYFKMDIRDSEMNQLGYISPSDDYWLFLRQNFKKLKTINFNGKIYLYKYTKMESI